MSFPVFELYGDDLAALAFPRGLIHGLYFFKPSMVAAGDF